MNKKLAITFILIAVVLGLTAVFLFNPSSERVKGNSEKVNSQKEIQKPEPEKIEGWQYTKWGMTVDQIVKASNGMARPINSAEQSSCSNPYYFKCIAVGSHEVNDLKFIVYFRSKLNGTTLNSVNLELVNTEKYESLKNQLNSKYGVVEPVYNDLETNYKWQAEPYAIELTRIAVGNVKIVELNYIDPQDSKNNSL
ncbi:hypothetical protein HLH17_06770 [Acinetobacter sp. ANC 5380]|uniref:Uncharacterized protein n=1 Tax=Acinetobacter terrae TaxID=2731247 RepID=A0A7Y2WAF1_9GAMM|nr:hypothetical protein [Acinetobacter terrae]NNH77376.1 hypothetical protein [Acinetobacter terrae]